MKTTGQAKADHLNIAALSIHGNDSLEAKAKHELEQSPQDAIPVKQDSLAVFRKMFASSTGSAPGSVKWTQLVQALTDAGLVATQATGSAVTFTSSQYGSVNLHKPHPEPVVDANMFRYMGKRLRKWFGWEGDRFVLRAKEENGVLT